MLSMYAIRQILNPETFSNPSDDFRIIQSWAEYDESSSKTPADRNLEYLCYELETMNPETGERTRFYKAIKFARVIRLPANAKQSTAFMDMQEQVLTGVHEGEYNLITIIANVIKDVPDPIGLLFLYGIQGVASTMEEAKKRAYYDFKGFIGMMQGTFRVLEMRVIQAKESEWLRKKMYNMDYLTMVRGIPKAGKAGEDAGNKGMGGMNINPDSQGTLEEIITGLADYEYIIEVLSTPVYVKTLMGWQRESQKKMTAWNSQLQGQKSISMNLSIPMMYMANASQSQGWSKGYTDARTVGFSNGESFSTSHGQSFGQSINQTFGQSVGQSSGTSLTNSVSRGVTHSQGVSFGESFGENQSVSHNVSNSVSHGINTSESWGQTHGVSRGVSQGVSFGQNIGQSEGTSRGVSTGSSLGYSQGYNMGLSNGKSVGMSANHGISQGVNIGRSSGLSRGVSTNESISQNIGQSYNTSHGRNIGFSHNRGVSINDGVSDTYGASVGGSTTRTHGQTQTQSSNWSHSDTTGESHGTGWSESDSNGRNFGHSRGTSANLNQSNSAASFEAGYDKNGHATIKTKNDFTGGVETMPNGRNANDRANAAITHEQTGLESDTLTQSGKSFAANNRLSKELGQYYNNGASAGISQNDSRGRTYGHNSGTSGNDSTSSSSSDNYGGGSSLSTSDSISNGSNWSNSHSVGRTHSVGQSESYGVSSGESMSQSWGVNSSIGRSMGIGNSLSQSQSASYGQSMGASDSYGTNMGSSMSQSYGLNAGQNFSQNVGMNAGANQSMSKGASTSSSMSTNVGVSDSVSHSKSVGESFSVSQSEGYGESYGTSHGINYGQSESVAKSQTLGQSVGQSLSKSVSESASTGYGQNVGETQGTSQGRTYSESNGTSRGISNGTTGSSTLGTSSSMGFGPSIGYNKSYQWLDQGVKDLLELMEYQNERIKKALRGQGAFYTYVYIACPTLDALATAQAVAKATWQNEFAMTQPLQVLDLSETEQKHLLYHFEAFSADVSKEDVFGLKQYKYCTVLLPEEYVAYTHLPRISEGGVFSTVQDIPKFSVPSMMRGEIYMGTVLNPERYTFNNGYKTQFDYRIPEESLMHGFFTGASRSGKTVAAMRFIAELSKVRRKKTGKRLRIVALDPKQDWRTLARFVEPERFNFYSLGNPTFRPVHINPWKLPYGVWPQIWIDGLIDIYCRAYGLLERGKQMIANVVFELYQEAGVFDSLNKPNWKELVQDQSAAVSFSRIYRRMEEKRDEFAGQGKAGNDTKDAYARLLERLSCFSRDYSIENQLYGTTDGISIDELIGADDVTVLESKGLENTFKNFIFGAITSGFYKFALAHEGGYLADDQYETVLVIEEANEVLTGNDAAGGKGGGDMQLAGQSEFEQILDQSAGYGLFIFAITQKIADMPSSIIANSGMVFAGKLKRPDDVTVVVRAVGREERIDDRDLVKWFPRSPTGWFVCQTSRTFDFKDADPVLVKIAQLNVNTPKNYELDEILLEKEVRAMHETA